MKTTLLITTFNRPEYLKRCLASVKRAGIKDVLIVDDFSTDNEAIELLKHNEYLLITKTKRLGICDSLIYGIQKAFDLGADIVINLDADSVIRNDYMERMIELHNAFSQDLITGFHSTTKNEDGSERHEIIENGYFVVLDEWVENNSTHGNDNIPVKTRNVNYCRKKSVGGINLLWTRETWNKYKPVIENAQRKSLNWDHQVSLASPGIICAVPSLVEHIGIESSMGHTGIPDIAADFKYLSLPNITLVCVDDNYERGLNAMNKCTTNINFGDTKLFSSSINAQLGVAEMIAPLNSKEGYSKFILKELHKYIDTDYALIVQHDGYMKNPEAWTDEFLKYDYIGATWWYKDGMNVGNGGFSLRSKRLLELSANLPTTNTHPEDHIICRDMRPYLESQGIKFAPEELANKFSFEGYHQSGVWNGQFGFHGQRAFKPPPDPRKQGIIVNQFLGLGDILFLVPMVRHWMQLGHDVIWPIADEYFNIKEYFPDIQFCRKSDWRGVQYNNPNEYNHKWQYGLYRVKPLRWNRIKELHEAMTSKYKMVGLDWQMWRQLGWQRNGKEKKLMEQLNPSGEKYQLICQDFGNVTDGGASYKVLPYTEGLKRIYLSKVPDFSLLDWSLLMENAEVIHAVSSSTLYMFEVLDLKAKEIHLYSRKGGGNDFEMVRPIMTKEYILHT